MNLTSYRHDMALVVHVGESRIDSVVAIQFKDHMRAICAGESATAAVVIMDLSQVSFLDSSGLGAIVSVMKYLAPERRLELAGLLPNVARVFRLTRMDSVFTIHDMAPAASGAAGDHAA